MASALVRLKCLSWEIPPLEPRSIPVAEKKQKGNQETERSAPKLHHPDDGAFGDLAIIQSRYKTGRTWTELGDLNRSKAGESVWLRGRVHARIGKGSMTFVTLRMGFYTVQCLVHKEISTPEMVKYAAKIPPESVVDIFGEVKEAKVDKATQGDVEIHVKRIYGISISEPVLPFQIEDASAPPESTHGEEKEEKGDQKGKQQQQKGKQEKQVLQVGQDVRLNNRWIDLRTPANHAIFKLQAAVASYFRRYFDSLGFVEIHSPKITPGVSEGGAAVFKTSYFGKTACLAQSPQLYKQMAVVSDLFKVYEIGPVFRAEDANTHRHMCEFMGLDFEMSIKEHYHEVLSVLGNLFVFIFDHIVQNHQAELSAVQAQYKFEPLQYPRDTLVLDFKEAMNLLKAAGEEVDDIDFTTPNEKALGKIVKAKYKTDFFIVDKYPLAARPFYTMPDPDTPGYTNSYDVFLRGEEITSGAQRIHDTELLKARATECGIPISNIAKYVESFKYGAFPHGGAGIGLERVVMLFLGLDNIRKSSLFPRDPKRLEP